MLSKIVLVLGVLIAVFVIVVALQPADYRIERSAVISAPAEVVFSHVNDLHKWQEFSPWAKIDPAAKSSYEGPVAGPGAVFRWSGNSQVGEGRMTITDSRPHEFVRFRLDFVRPFEGTSEAEFAFKPETRGTTVTWSMSGKNNFVAKAMCLFMDQDKMIGGEFEKGLASLRVIAESAPAS